MGMLRLTRDVTLANRPHHGTSSRDRSPLNKQLTELHLNPSGLAYAGTGELEAKCGAAAAFKSRGHPCPSRCQDGGGAVLDVTVTSMTVAG